LLRTAKSRIIGWPPSIAYRARSSAPACPAHDTASTSCSTLAVRPVIALYWETSHLSGSASDAPAVTSVSAAAIYIFIVCSLVSGAESGLSHQPLAMTTLRFLERYRTAEARHSGRYDARRETELRAGQAVDRRDAARVQRIEHLEIQLDVLALTDPEPLGRLDRNDLDRGRGVGAVLSHPQRDGPLSQNARGRGELLRPLLAVARLRTVGGRERDVHRKVVGAAGARFPVPGVVDREPIVVRALRRGGDPEPPVVLGRPEGRGAGPLARVRFGR